MTEQGAAAPDGDPSFEGDPTEDVPGEGDGDLDTEVEDALVEASPAHQKVLLFVGVLLAVGVFLALAFLAMDLPQCVDPDIDWIPCIGP